MKLLSKEEFKKLSKKGLHDYITAYLESLAESSNKKSLSSESYKLPAWPYMQAEQIGVQKTINKVLKLITYD